MVFYPWIANLNWDNKCFKLFPVWIQIWQIPLQWILIEIGKKIVRLLGNTLDVLIVETWGKEDRHIMILTELDLSKPLIRGAKLKYKQSEIWIQF